MAAAFIGGKAEKLRGKKWKEYWNKNSRQSEDVRFYLSFTFSCFCNWDWVLS